MRGSAEAWLWVRALPRGLCHLLSPPSDGASQQVGEGRLTVRAAPQLWAMMKAGTETVGVRGGCHDLGSSLSVGPRSESGSPCYPGALSGSWVQSTRVDSAPREHQDSPQSIGRGFSHSHHAQHTPWRLLVWPHPAPACPG